MMMMLILVMTVFVRDHREYRLHQVEVVDPAQQHQHLVNVLWNFWLLVIAV